MAQQDTRPIFDSLRSGFSGPASGAVLVAILLVAIFVVAGVSVVLYLRSRQEARANLNSPRELFLELCAAHELTADEKQVLIKLARVSKFRRPDRVFVRPEVFDKRAIVGMSDQIQNLRDRLFHV